MIIQWAMIIGVVALAIAANILISAIRKIPNVTHTTTTAVTEEEVCLWY